LLNSPPKLTHTRAEWGDRSAVDGRCLVVRPLPPPACGEGAAAKAAGGGVGQRGPPVRVLLFEVEEGIL